MIRRRALLAFLAAAPFNTPALAQGTPEDIAERRVKAAYLYRFTNYVEWPESALARPDSPLVIGVWGNDELADDLGVLAARRGAGERLVEVRRAAALAGVHMLFISHSRNQRLAEALIPETRPLLVVTEWPGALKQGGMINFLLDEGQIRFEVSPEAAEKRGIKLSSRLISVSQNTPGRAR